MQRLPLFSFPEWLAKITRFYKYNRVSQKNKGAGKNDY